MDMNDRNTHLLSRRSFIGLGVTVAIGGAALLTGCSSSDGGSAGDGSSGKIVMLNYEGWMGENEVTAFKEASGIDVEELPTPDGGDSAWINTISQNKGSYDLALAGINVSKKLKDNGLLADFDASKVPNLSKIPAEFTEAFPYGIPVEQGKIGFMYNKELLPDPPKSWKELFSGAEGLSGKLLFPAYDSDIIAAGLLANDLDISTENLDDIEVAKQAVIAIKPHIKAFVDAGAPAQVIDGSAVLAVAYDYDYASAASESDTVAWIAPSEGMPAYLDGWVPLADSTNLDAVYEFMNFHLEGDQYADFINTTWASWIMPDVESLLLPEIAENEALQLEQSSEVIYHMTTAEIQQANSAAWQEIQNA